MKPNLLLCVLLCACGQGVDRLETPGVETPGIANKAAASTATTTSTPVTSNPAICPATWAEARALCTPTNANTCNVDVLCWYPGAGDGLADGTYATALLECSTDASHPNPNRWLCAQ